MIADVEHEPLINDELFDAAEQRFAERGRRAPRGGAQVRYLLTGMVKCATGHQPLEMHGKRRKGHTYLTCDYGRAYGHEAADQIPDHGQWLYLREDKVLPVIETFFAQHVFGPMRLEKLEQQLRAHQRRETNVADTARTRLDEQITALDRRIGHLLDALENGLDADVVRQRLTKLRDDREALDREQRALPRSANDHQAEDPAALLARVPDLTQAMRDAPLPLKRQLFEAFGLQILHDRTRQRLDLSATITAQLAATLIATPEVSEIPDPADQGAQVHVLAQRRLQLSAPVARNRTEQ